MLAVQMNAAPSPPSPNNDAEQPEPPAFSEASQSEFLDLPSASDTSVYERGTLTGRWETLSRQLARLPVVMMLASLLLGLGIVQLTFQIGNSIYRSVTWERETHETLGQVATLQRNVHILQDAERMASDPSYLMELARCQGFVGSSEHVVVANNAPSNPGYSCSPVRLP